MVNVGYDVDRSYERPVSVSAATGRYVICVEWLYVVSAQPARAEFKQRNRIYCTG